MANPILSVITQFGSISVPSFSQQLYDKREAVALAQFNENLKEEVIAQLKLINYVFLSDDEFETFASARLTVISITGTDTKMVCLDVEFDLVDPTIILSYGTSLAQWQGKGYEVVIQDPSVIVKSFE